MEIKINSVEATKSGNYNKTISALWAEEVGFNANVLVVSKAPKCAGTKFMISLSEAGTNYSVCEYFD